MEAAAAAFVRRAAQRPWVPLQLRRSSEQDFVQHRFTSMGDMVGSHRPHRSVQHHSWLIVTRRFRHAISSGAQLPSMPVLWRVSTDAHGGRSTTGVSCITSNRSNVDRHRFTLEDGQGKSAPRQVHLSHLVVLHIDLGLHLTVMAWSSRRFIHLRCAVATAAIGPAPKPLLATSAPGMTIETVFTHSTDNIDMTILVVPSKTKRRSLQATTS